MRSRLLFIFFWLWSAVSVQASEKFFTRHDVNYSFDSQGLSKVEQTISLTNKESGFYASSYQITLSGDPPGTITGYDAAGPLKIEVSHPDIDTTVASIAFNEQVVGINQTQKFTLFYSGRAADHNGQVWEIVLPKLGNNVDIDEYNLHLKVPQSFGQLAYISPSPASVDNRTYTFSKEQIKKVSVVAAFGNFQAYDFNLEYKLNNPNRLSAVAQIALPPDTPYQRIMYSSIDPQPEKIEVDEDGNWLATFRVAAKQEVVVKALGQVHLLAEPTKTRPPLSEEQRKTYTLPTTYWPAEDLKIVELARELKTPQEIYNYVTATLSYDKSIVGSASVRKGGLGALNSPQLSICTEFTDLFITLARAAGIPAREVNGYGYTTDQNLQPLGLGDDLFHAWPQYWDDLRQAWISVDPTWGNTTGGIDYFNKLDFNHFTFTIHGTSDSEPILSVSSAEIKYGIYKDFPTVTPQVAWTPPIQVLPLVSNRSKVTISNPLGVAIYDIALSATTSNIESRFQAPSQIAVLLPFTAVEYPLYLSTPFLPTFTDKKATIFVADMVKSYNVEAKLFLFWQVLLGITIASIVASMGWITSKAWGLYLQKRK